MDHTPSRRTVITSSGLVAVGLAGCLGSDPEESEVGSETTSNPENSLEWGGQGSENATQDCGPDDVGFWKWILTPGGPTPLEVAESMLTVTFEDGTEATAEGFRPGEGGGAVQFEIFKDGGGTVDSAIVEFNGGSDNSILTISEGACLEGENDDPELEVETQVATEINGSTATLNGELLEFGGFDSVTVFFEWRPVGEETFQQTENQTLTELGPFSAEISDLEAGGRYEFFAVAEANDERVAGEVIEFVKDEEEEDEEEDEEEEEEEDEEEKKPDIKNDVHLKGVCYDDTDGKKTFKYRVTNDTKYKLKLSWKAKQTAKGGKVTVPKNGHKYISVATEHKSITVALYLDETEIESAHAETVSSC